MRLAKTSTETISSVNEIDLKVIGTIDTFKMMAAIQLLVLVLVLALAHLKMYKPINEIDLKVMSTLFYKSFFQKTCISQHLKGMLLRISQQH